MPSEIPSLRSRVHRLQALATIALFAFGFWQGVGALLAPAARQQLEQALSVEALLDGTLASTVNNMLAHALPIDADLRGAVSLFRRQSTDQPARE